MNRFEFFATIERYHTIQNPTSQEKLDLAARYCGIRDGMRVLDVGCGKGWMLRRLAGLGAGAAGVPGGGRRGPAAPPPDSPL